VQPPSVITASIPTREQRFWNLEEIDIRVRTEGKANAHP
jgi:hypothetical protein